MRVTNHHFGELTFPNGQSVAPGATIGVPNDQWEMMLGTGPGLVESWLAGGFISAEPERRKSDAPTAAPLIETADMASEHYRGPVAEVRHGEDDEDDGPKSARRKK